MRGNRTESAPIRSWPGSIPACAGEPPFNRSCIARNQVYPRVCGGTSAPTFPVCSIPVYPRVCGGTAILTLRVKGDEGLSPRVRGNHIGARSEKLLTRSIPACAGEPPQSELFPFLLRVYPRVCGGTRNDTTATNLWSGLSPRVRGNRRLLVPGATVDGSIPACAGEPV